MLSQVAHKPGYRKHLISSILSLFIYLAICLTFTACEKKTSPSPAETTQEQTQSAPHVDTPTSDSQVEVMELPESESTVSEASWSQHILNTTQGWVSSAQVLKIHFSHKVATESELNVPLEGRIVASPEMEFQATFSALDELSITPANPLPSGKVFSISLLPNKLLDVPESLGPFNFQIQVLKQDYELQISGLVPSEQKNLMTLKGSVRTTDLADNGDIERTISLMQEEKALTINWTHHADKLNHDFVIDSIVRGQQSSTVELKYSAANLDVDQKGTRTIEVPALNQFKITAVRTIQRPKQYIEVSFSEALDRNQNLNGLIRLNKESASIRVDGSALLIYPNSSISGVASLEIEDTIRSAKNIQLSESFTGDVTFISELPGVRFVGTGSILPPTNSLTVPFEAINVNAVWVTAFKVYENNIQQFLQSYSPTSNHADTRTGRYLWKKKITLPSVPFDKWQRYDIDLNEIMENHGDGIVNLKLNIDRSSIAYSCSENNAIAQEQSLQSYDGPNMQESIERPNWFYQYYSQNNGYVTYEERSDPCEPGYYSFYNTPNITDARNFIVSDIGLIVKKGDGNTLHVITTSIKTGEANRKVKLNLYNFQNQLLTTALTDKQGMASLEPKSTGFYLIAEKDKDRAYLRLPRNEALPTSQFDTGGEKIYRGIKGFIFGERDVWRPGDAIFLTFVLQDKENKIPQGHPVSLDFFDPRGVKITTEVSTKPVGDLYTFQLKTDESSPTGNWRAVVRVGGEYFDKVIKVETITPNRLKVETTPAQRPMRIGKTPIRTELFAQWLNGATAKNLRADAELILTPMETTFDGWSQYHFDDPASPYKRFASKVFDNTLDAKGQAAFDLNLSHLSQAPGKLRATFVTRVFEQSGNFSTSIRNEEVLPYENWVGLNIAKGSGYQGAIARDKDHPLEFVVINSDGKTQANRKLTLSIYRIGWRWWWDHSDEDLSNYIRSTNNQSLVEAQLTSDDKGRASWTLEKNKYEWGRHLVRVCDIESGHCSGKEVYLGWDWNNQVNPDSATQLVLATDKSTYVPGDIARISIPELAQGKILYSLENGSKVLQQQWLDLKPGATYFEIPVTEEMAPNVFVNAVLLLPHQQRKTDAPIRLYGITPLIVNNPENHLNPQLDVPDTVRPESTFEVTVKEEKNKKMSYTLAVVDEGLLGITGYKAPDPYTTFYRREALGVLTWDMFDGVVGAYGASLERLLKIGGSDSASDDKKDKERRFPPVVKFLGAFTLETGQSKTHSITLPQYMGAVRVMVVAAENGAYGKAEKSITVTQPLTVLATLPRVVGPNEKVSLPVNVFVNNNDIKKVDVTVSTNDIFTIEKATHTFEFTEPGDQIASLQLEAADRTGKGEVKVIAKSGDEIAEQIIYIDSRSPNVASTMQQYKLLQPGEIWQATLQPHGMATTNVASIAVSSFPPLNMDKRLGYLIRYPHGCIEQTTSAIFPQITLHNIVDLSDGQRDNIQTHVLAAISKYRNFQNANGGFSYWPGGPYINDWSSIYATHFLVEAKSQGYGVPKAMLDDALDYLKKLSTDDQHEYSRLVNAYRLYILALAASPDVASMNRLREALIKSRKHHNDNVARWQLASAYQHLGLVDIAEELMSVEKNTVSAYRYGHYTYGSDLRDEAILLFAYKATNKETEAWELASEIAKRLSQDQWYSTHSTAWALLALSNYASNLSATGNRFSISEGTQSPTSNEINWQALQTEKAIYKQNIAPHVLRDAALQIRNDGDHPLHVEIANTGIPSEGQEIASNNGLSMHINFSDMNGDELDVSKLSQGQDFIAEVSINADDSRNSYKIEDIAMTLSVPSGWQIRNQRLEGDAVPEGLDYQDIRDDAVLSYFSLWKNYHWYYRYNDRNRNSQTIRVILNASFSGKFYLPGWQVKSMYDEDIAAQSVGQWVEVLPQD